MKPELLQADTGDLSLIVDGKTVLWRRAGSKWQALEPGWTVGKAQMLDGTGGGRTWDSYSFRSPDGKELDYVMCEGENGVSLARVERYKPTLVPFSKRH
jgi:hypothetical protein